MTEPSVTAAEPDRAAAFWSLLPWFLVVVAFLVGYYIGIVASDHLAWVARSTKVRHLL